jgi:hypothetical protein
MPSTENGGHGLPCFQHCQNRYFFSNTNFPSGSAKVFWGYRLGRKSETGSEEGRRNAQRKRASASVADALNLLAPRYEPYME